MRRLLFAVIVAGVLFSCHTKQKFTTSGDDFYINDSAVYSQDFERDVPENIILLVGDGMGMAHVQFTSLAFNGFKEKLTIEKMPVTGLMSTYSLGGSSDYTSGGITTDSAASVTSFSTGNKTTNGSLGVDKDGNKLTSFRELAEQQGWVTGVIATKSVTDATPAGFYAHVPNRDMHKTIAQQLVSSDIEVALGGGAKYFGGLKNEIETNGFQLVRNSEELKAVNSLPVIGLFANDKMKELQPEPYLFEMAEKSIELLDATGKNFFLMVEGSQIDTYSHVNNSYEVYRRTLIFDMAVRKAVEYASTKKNTLVVVLADHETGGLVVHNYDGRVQYQWTSTKHSTSNVGVFAYGPGAEQFTGVFDSTQINKRFANFLN